MNLVLFDPAEVGRPLANADPRAEHLLGVLKRREGETFDAGILNGPIGKGRITAQAPDGLEWTFAPGEHEAGREAPASPIHLIVGLPRPQTARKILQEATALGVRAIHFVVTAKGDPGYGTSTLWSSGEWRRHVRSGLEQAFATVEPVVTHGLSLEAAWAAAPAGPAVALDNYEASTDLGSLAVNGPLILAIGGERGWSAAEREFFRVRGATLAHLGRRVLRAETACAVALGIVAARMRNPVSPCG